ncbi:MAG: hypothetical protein GY873_36765 [Bosea sp.]|uniref:hypothetical protein n=1 Tax=Bosea sp. (in: a-proteobacteria) TaxID=1871050 RepID=UPI0023963283|nr:hypothetical protein [Bosea sp. (in: a-proteobacteria)]MCP4739754.1 hypothetical protein [Bosea sp. (in: a-proteobacteria)]
MSTSMKLGLGAAALIATTLYAAAQIMPEHPNMPGHGAPAAPLTQPNGGIDGSMGDNMTRMQKQMMQGQGGMRQPGMMNQKSTALTQPTLPGQDAFGAIQEVVRLLEADPVTDWSKVSIAALREHLIDMNEVTLRATVDEKRLSSGVEATVTGEGRVAAAIKRMVPAHAQELKAMNDWAATTEDLPNGVRLTVTTSDAKQVPKLQALGFMGLMVQGSHHQPHHLAMAKGTVQH